MKKRILLAGVFTLSIALSGMALAQDNGKSTTAVGTPITNTGKYHGKPRGGHSKKGQISHKKAPHPKATPAAK